MDSPNSGNSRPDISAQNSASGCQYLGPGDGDQNVASSNGVQYNDRSDRRQFTTTLALNMPADVPGMPSVWNLAQALNGSGKEPTEPTRKLTANLEIGITLTNFSSKGSILVDWLMRQPEHSPLDSSRQHIEIVNQVTPKTGTWILSTKEIQKWRDASNSSHRCLGVHGILGSGKTVLASLIIDALRNEIKQQNDTACIYFYFHEGDDNSPPVARIWSTLLAQLLQQEGPKGVSEELKSKFNNSFRGSAPVHPLEYFKLFEAQAFTFKTVYLVIDALDSCTNGRDERTRHIMQQALKQLPPNIRVLFTSRSDTLTRDLGVSQKLQVIPNQSDIETYVKDRIDGDSDLHRVLADTKHRKDVVSRVTELTITSGMFLLARLHMDNLSKQGTLADIKDALSRLPATSSRAFEASVRRILRTDNTFESDLAKHVLTWVVHAKVGLTVNQVGDSFAIHKSKGCRYQESRPPKDSVMASCAGLVVEDHETNTLRLVHESVQTHLRKHQVMPKYADLEMAKICLISLLMDETWHFHSPLLAYSVTHWCSHLGQSTDAQVRELVNMFLGDSNSLARTFRTMPELYGSTFGGITGLHAAVYFNQLTWIKRLLKAGIDINSQCSNGQTALHWAAIHGRYHLLEYLIRKSADTNIRDATGDTALHKILMGPTPEALPAVRALIHGGAKIDIKGGKGLTPLSSAIRYGPTSIALLLIKSQADVNVEVTKGWTSLKEVFYHGHEIIHSLGKGTGGNSGSSPDGWTPLRDAVKDHVRCLIHLLLERGVDLNRPTTDGWLPLLHAVRAGSLVVLQHLLEREPNPAGANQRDPKDGKPALYWAFFHERYSAVKLLIKHGANVNEKNVNGWIPLIEAVQKRNEDMVWFLIKKGARIDQTDSKGWSPLLYAIENQRKNIVWLLIANKANVKHRSINAPNPIDLALKQAQYSIAWLLCEHGADINSLDDKGMTSLHRACHSGRLKEVAFLLDNGAESRLKDTAGFTALHYAVLSGWEDIVSLLASRGSVRAIIDEPDAQGNRAVMLATLRKSKPMLQALIDSGAACEDQDSTGLTALHHAARLGFNEGLELLMSEVSDVDFTDKKGFTAVHHAINSGIANPDTIKLFKAGGGDLEVQEHSGLTPLMLAVHLGRPSLTRQLLIQGANAHAQNEKGWTAMDLANTTTREHAKARRILERALQG